MTVGGSITGTTTGNKLVANFDIPHVRDSKKRIRHIVTEGPEPGIYVRGQLKDKNIIELPEYWDGLIDPESITVTLTQIGYSQDLIVDKIEWGKRIVVKSGTGANIHCFMRYGELDVVPMNHDEKLTVVYEGDTLMIILVAMKTSLLVDGTMIVEKPNGKGLTPDHGPIISR